MTTADPALLPDTHELKDRLQRLGLFGLLASWNEIDREPWVERLVALEEQERKRRSLERRLKNARIGAFKSLADFDWTWPTKIDRELVDHARGGDYLAERRNVVLAAAQGLGKTMMAQNLAHQAVLKGHSVLFVTAAQLLLDLGSQESSRALDRRLKHYAKVSLLVLDEVGYLAFDNRNADLLFQVVSRRYEKKSLVLTTNLAFSAWPTVFPNATCATALIDRVIHHAEVIAIEGESYRLREATERAGRRAPTKKK